MTRTVLASPRLGTRQFSIAQLFDWVTWCAVIAAFAAAIGPAAAGFLMAMALALGVRQGLLALAMLAAATLAADCEWPGSIATATPVSHNRAVLLVILLAAALAIWYWSRRNRAFNRRRANVSASLDLY